jgi:hypothetical protein
MWTTTSEKVMLNALLISPLIEAHIDLKDAFRVALRLVQHNPSVGDDVATALVEELSSQSPMRSLVQVAPEFAYLCPTSTRMILMALFRISTRMVAQCIARL